MIRFMHQLLPALAALAALAWAPSVRAEECARPAGVIRSTPTADPTVRAFTGRVYPFGAIRGGLEIFVDPATGLFVGFIDIQARGGTVTGVFEGQFLPVGDFALLFEEITFTGGTGRYAGVSGHATVVGVLDLLTGEGRDVVVDGRVCLPGDG